MSDDLQHQTLVKKLNAERKLLPRVRYSRAYILTVALFLMAGLAFIWGAANGMINMSRDLASVTAQHEQMSNTLADCLNGKAVTLGQDILRCKIITK